MGTPGDALTAAPLPQPARHRLRLVPQPPQVHQVPHLHAVQVAHHQDRAGAARTAHAGALPLQPPRLHGQEAPGGVRSPQPPRGAPPGPVRLPLPWRGLSRLPGEPREPLSTLQASGPRGRLLPGPCPSGPCKWVGGLPHLAEAPPFFKSPAPEEATPNPPPGLPVKD